MLLNEMFLVQMAMVYEATNAGDVGVGPWQRACGKYCSLEETLKKRFGGMVRDYVETTNGQTAAGL